jgi:hypothetical protein
VILFQIDLVFCDELETIYEGCSKTKDTFIFAWFSIHDIRHYHWSRGLIRQRPSNKKVDYLVRTIQRILDFLQL